MGFINIKMCGVSVIRIKVNYSRGKRPLKGADDEGAFPAAVRHPAEQARMPGMRGGL